MNAILSPAQTRIPENRDEYLPPARNLNNHPSAQNINRITKLQKVYHTERSRLLELLNLARREENDPEYQT